MRLTPLIALGLGHVAMAQNTTSFSWSPSSTSSAPSSVTSNPSSRGFPATIGDYQFYGCTSGSGFPGFEKVASSQDMSLSLCEASCPGRFFGTFSTDCYCGENIDEQTVKRVPNSDCNIPCPGSDTEFCGGRAGLPPVGRRQNIPIQVLLTLYIRINDGDITVPPTTATSTITSTTTGTITTCPPEHPHCPIGSTTVGVTKILSEFCPEPTPDYSHKKKVIVCYGDYCVPQLPCDGHCTKHRIVCDDSDLCHPEECETEEWNQLVRCSGDDCHYTSCSGDACHAKIICYDGHCSPAECYGDECQKKLVCHGDECVHEQCNGEDCYQKWNWNDNEGHYLPVPPTTKPAPPPAGPPAHPPAGPPSGPPAGPPANNKYPCSGAECGSTNGQGAPSPTGGVIHPPTGGNHTPPAVGDAGKLIPALGLGVVAGMAFFL